MPDESVPIDLGAVEIVVQIPETPQETEQEVDSDARR